MRAFFTSKSQKLLYSQINPCASFSSCSSQDQIFLAAMAPKRSQEDTATVSPARPRSKLRISQLFSTMAAPKVFASEANYRCYTELFHGRDLVVGRRFNLSTLTATRLEFEDKLIQCGLRSLATMEQVVFPKWVWQFYSKA